MSSPDERLDGTFATVGLKRRRYRASPAVALRRGVDDEIDRGAREQSARHGAVRVGLPQEPGLNEVLHSPTKSEPRVSVKSLSIAVAAVLFLCGYVAIAATDTRPVAEIEGR